jgi:pimeloyl-ACP methyl ester carboxylesterase
MSAPQTSLATETATERVTSKDGTPIAYQRTGEGPAVILVDGAMGYRGFGSSLTLASMLAPHLTVLAYDRRGRGESGDTQPYAPEREIEDIEALMNVAGGQASLYGISSGGALALEAAAALGDRVPRLALYEIPYDSSDYGVRLWREYREQLTDVLAAGQRGEAVVLFMKLVGASSEGVKSMQAQPVWATFEAIGPTLAYDAAVLGEDRIVPVSRTALITADTLVMDGSASLEPMPFMRASALELLQAIPSAQHRILPDQSHEVAAEVLAPVLAEFFSGGSR